MSDNRKTTTEFFARHFGSKVEVTGSKAGIVSLDVAAEHWLEVCRELRDSEELAYQQLTDLCGVDYMGYGQTEWETSDATSEGFSRAVDGQGPGRFNWSGRPELVDQPRRFAVIVHLLSFIHNRRLRLRCFAMDEGMPMLPSLVEIWNSSDWYEREAFDLIGIVFEGHPDLRRILTDYGFIGHPFRKDFPLIGNVAMRYDPEKKRVIYEPVEIEPRVGVPRVLRHDSRYKTDDIDLAAESDAGQDQK